MAFDVNSGSLYKLDELAYQLVLFYLESGDWEAAQLKAGNFFGVEAAAEAWGEIEDLVKAGYLFSPGEEWPAYAPGKDLGLKALCLNIAHECNMDCGYCFVPENIRQQEKIMSEEVIARALDMLLEETPYGFLTVDFFGGEPLLNFPGIKFAVDYARKKGADKEWKFTVTTNTLLLDKEKLAYFQDQDFSFVLSCDGRPGVHDHYRVTTGGSGTSKIVTKRIKEFLEAGAATEYFVRGTYTRDNLDFAEDVLFMAELGAKSISLEPVVGPDTVPYALKEEDLPRISSEYYKLARALRGLEQDGSPVSFYHFALDLTGGPCVAKRLTGCGAGYQYLAVTPAGEIYPCHQLVGHEDYLMGDVFQGVTALDLRDKLQEAHLFNKKDCSSCWARFLCGGGCHSQAIFNGGD